MPYAILRFQKRKAGSVAACERHNERKKEAYKSNPDIDMECSKHNYHLVPPPRYTYKKEINRMVQAAGCKVRKDSVMMVETLIRTLCKMLQKSVAKKNPDTYEPWMKALMCAVGQSCDWTDEKYLLPLIDYLEK